MNARLSSFLLTTALLIAVLVVVGGIMEAGGRFVARTRLHRMLVTFPITGWKDVHQYDPELMWALKPNVQNARQICSQEKPVESFINTNDVGLRNPPITDKGSRRRILAIGCSTTFGAGVNDNETWPAQLQAILDEVSPENYDVINAGVSGYSAYQGLRYLEKRGMALDPDIVIVCFGQNDHARIPIDGLHDLDWYNPDETSGVTVLLREALKGMGLVWRGPDIQEKEYRLSYGQFFDVMMHIRFVCSQNNVACAFMIWPYEYELDLDPFMPPCSTIRSLATYCAAQVIDLAEMIRNSKEELYYDGLHMNARGNRLVAEKVARDLGFTNAPVSPPAQVVDVGQRETQ